MGGSRAGSSEGSPGQRAYRQTPFFHLLLEKRIFLYREQDAGKMIRQSKATCWRLRECIRVREFASTHKLEQMRRLSMPEKQKAWKGKPGFDQIEIIAEIRA